MRNIRIDYKKLGELGLRGPGVRKLVAQEGAKRLSRLAGMIGADNVDGGMGGVSRGRYTIRRLQPLTRETRDGALSRTLHGGGQ